MTYLVITAILSPRLGRYHYHHLPDEEINTQRGSTTYPSDSRPVSTPILLLLLPFLLQSTFYLSRLPLLHCGSRCLYMLQSREVIAYNSHYFKRLPLKLLLLEMIDLKTVVLCMNMSSNDKL